MGCPAERVPRLGAVLDGGPQSSAWASGGQEMGDIEAEIRAIVDRETRAWDTKNLDLLLSVFHPDMVWPWPGDHRSADPMSWTLEFGRYDRERWGAAWEAMFEACELVCNQRSIQRIVVSPQGDGAMAIVDIDTRWRDAQGREDRWYGRTCKIYSKVRGEWKMITQLGTFEPPPTSERSPPCGSGQ